MPRRKKKKKLFYFGLKNNGKHSAHEVDKKELEEDSKNNLKEIEKQNKIEEKQKKKEEKERRKRIENKTKEIRKNKKKETKEEQKTNKYTNRKNEEEVFNFEGEIVLGLNDNIAKKKEKSKTIKNLRKPNKSGKKKVKRKNKKISFLIKCTSFILIAAAGTTFILTSPELNIKKILLKGNEKISYEEIVKISELQINENIFKINKKQIISNIKNNPYIKSVEINRKLPDTLEIKVEERTEKYIIEYAGKYMYIDNQGYLLNQTENIGEMMIISGFNINEENIQKTKRLEQKDLLKLGEVNKILETSNNYKLYNYINKIDVTENKDYIIHMEKISKTIYIGDSSDLDNKMLHLKEIIDKTQEKSGIIFINGNLNGGFKPYFRENV